MRTGIKFWRGGEISLAIAPLRVGQTVRVIVVAERFTKKQVLWKGTVGVGNGVQKTSEDVEGGN